MKELYFLIVIGLSLTNVKGQHMQEYNQYYNVSNATGKGDTIETADALPSFTDLLGKHILVPQIEIKGSTNFKANKFLYGDVRIFTSVIPTKQNTTAAIFFPETSAYGISMSFNVLPEMEKPKSKSSSESPADENKWICAYLGAHYLGKGLYGLEPKGADVDTVRFISDIGHIKIGIQLIPFKNILSFYGDFNSVITLANRSPVKEHLPSLSNGFSNFFNVGTKFYLTKVQAKSLNVFVDFSATIMNHSIKKIYATSDKIIPRISIGGTVKF